MSCYYDAYGNYYCNDYYFPTAARVGISLGVLFFVFIILALFFMRRRRQVAARNALLLQNQVQQPGLVQQPGFGNQWGPPPGSTPYGSPPGVGYPNAGSYPMQPNPTGGYGGSPQPFQPGYAGGYTGAPGGEAKGYDAAPGTNSHIQAPPTSYRPDAPGYNPNANYASNAPATNNAVNDPPSYSGFSALSGVPPPGVGASGTGGSNPYYNPPDTTKT